MKPKRLDHQNRVKFFSHSKNANISAEKYLQELRELYSNSNYGDEIKKETLIRDKFITGIDNTQIKSLLFLQDPDHLTINKCLELAASIKLTIAPKPDEQFFGNEA